MVRFEDGVTKARINEIWAAENIQETVFLPNVGVFVVTSPVGVEAQVLRQRLSAYSEVRFAEIDAHSQPLEGK